MHLLYAPVSYPERCSRFPLLLCPASLQWPCRASRAAIMLITVLALLLPPVDLAVNNEDLHCVDVMFDPYSHTDLQMRSGQRESHKLNIDLSWKGHFESLFIIWVDTATQSWMLWLPFTFKEEVTTHLFQIEFACNFRLLFKLDKYVFMSVHVENHKCVKT